MDRTGGGRAGRARGAPRRAARTATATAVAIGSALALAGCGLLGSGAGSPTPTEMSVSSSAFPQNVMPDSYTCGARGGAINPPLSWAGAPAVTKSIALVVDDAAAPITPYVYWIVFDINPATSEVAQGKLPSGAREALNSAGKTAYYPPCPGPHGHMYRFTVYALNKVLDLPAGTSLESAWSAIAAATIGRGRLQVSATTATR